MKSNFTVLKLDFNFALWAREFSLSRSLQGNFFARHAVREFARRLRKITQTGRVAGRRGRRLSRLQGPGRIG